MKKRGLDIVSLIVSLCLAAALAVPASAGLDGDYHTDIPTVYMKGQGNELFVDKNDRNSEKINNIDVPDGYIGDEAKKLIRPLAKGLLTDDWSDWVDQFIESVAPLFEKQALDENGEASNGSGIDFTGVGGNKANADGTYRIGAYAPQYDWRLDPYVIADQLHSYIVKLKRSTGFDKVNLIGRSIGASVVLAYLDAYGADDLETVVLYCPSFLGMETISKAFAGKITISPEGAADFLSYLVESGMADEYLGSDEYDDALSVLADIFSAMVALHTVDIPAAVLDRIWGRVYTDVYPRLLVRMYGSMPSFWSLVGDDDYEQAKQNVFNGQEDVYAGLIEKIDAYHYNVMNKTEELLEGLIADGAKIQVVAKYGLPMIPAVEGSQVESDMLTSVYSATYKATCADYGSTLSSAYLSEAESRGAGKYVSPDKKIDASTCLLPDHTWFIRDVAHRSMPEGINSLFEAILDHEGYMTVFDDGAFPQYLSYDSETDSLSAVEPSSTPPRGILAFFARIGDFFRRLFNVIAKLFKG